MDIIYGVQNKKCSIVNQSQLLVWYTCISIGDNSGIWLLKKNPILFNSFYLMKIYLLP